MGIFGKLTGSFSIVAIICTIVGTVGWFGINSTEKGLIEVAEVRLPAIHGIGLMMEGVNSIKAAERTMLISGLNNQERQHEVNNLKKRWAIFQEGYDLYTPLPQTPEEAEVWKKLLPALADFKKEHQKLATLVQDVELDAIENLETVLVKRQLDHIHWVANLEHAVIAGQEFTGQLNPTLCGFGKWQGTFTSEDQKFNEIIKQMTPLHESLHALGQQINRLIGQGKTAAARSLFTQKGRALLDGIEKEFTGAIEYVGEDIAELEEARAIGFGSERAAFKLVDQYLDDIAQINTQVADKARQSAKTAAVRSKITTIIAVILGTIIALCFGFLLSRSISRPMNKAVRMVEELGQGHLNMRLNMDRADEIGRMATAIDKFADDLQHVVVKALQQLAVGDLTFTATIKDEKDVIGTALVKTSTDLNSMVGDILAATEQLAAGSGQIADSSQALSQGATESAASLQQISSSMAELASRTRSDAENASQANQLANQARDTAEKGNAQMQNMVGAMAEINEAGQNISKIIKVIDEIAFQTNLLALNAAVEAARAGRHGKGFAVVAEEVRNLAARSAKAAKETAELIEGSVQKTGAGSEIANQTAESLAEIVNSVVKVSNLVGEISESANDQAEGISQITQGLGQIDKVTQANTASAEEGAAAAEELSSQSAHLKGLMEAFTMKRSHSPAAQRALPTPPVAQTEFQEWGDPVSMGQTEAKASEIITLDDKEFGRY